ncbi:MAG: tetratricopeptide repeat protein [Treponema sp.]|jgi:tetratricopeptide (TPR) repeat protein|nr:tetratricopeptide repeat protein [Treponema sp.]
MKNTNKPRCRIWLMALVLLISAASCATAGGAAGDGLTLEEAVEQAASDIARMLPPKTRLAIVEFDSESPALSGYLIEELSGALFDSGVMDIAERRSLDFARSELQLQHSGEISDASALSIGQFLGARSVIYGELVDTGSGSRFRLSVLNVETGTREGAVRLTVRGGRDIKRLIAALNKRQGASAARRMGNAAPNSPGAYVDRGISAAAAGNFDAAIAAFNEALRMDPNYAAAYRLRGLALLASVSAVISITENFASFNLHARPFTQDEQPTARSAIEDLTKSIVLTPTASAYLSRGLAYNGLGEYDKAIADYTYALMLDPNIALAHNNRGLAYLIKSEYDPAIKDFNKAIKLDPHFALAYFNRGKTYVAKNNYDRAIADLTQAIRIDSNVAEFYFFRGFGYESKGDHDRAIADFTQYITFQPDDWSVYNILFNICIEKGDIDQALEIALQATKRFPDDWDGYDNLGYGYEKKGDIVKAKDAYLQAENLAPNPNPNLDGAYYNRPEARSIMKQ